MLTQLHIQNIAVIQKATIQFREGLNVFTGETGAGKTILIAAIDAVLGERASRDIIRTGEDRAFVSALFENISPVALGALEELGYPDEDGAVLISREITAAGKNTCKINGMPATVSILKSISSLLIHIHGQRDSQQLLRSERHRELVDAFGSLEGDVAAYKAAFDEMRRIKAELESLNLDEAQKAQRLDMLGYQIAEIEAAALEDEDEEESLLVRKKIIKGSESILEGLGEAYQALAGDGESGAGVQELMDAATEGMERAAAFVEALEPTARRLREIGYELEEFQGEIRRSLEGYEFDPRELDALEYRLDTIYKLKKKYGGGIPEILAYLERAREELERITLSEQRTAQLTQELAAAEKKAEKLAAALTKKRLAAAERFTGSVERELIFLDMPSVTLTVSHGAKALAADGADELELLFCANVGEVPRPLSKIASGGELSRMMLAIKNVLAHRDHIDTLIFDEVDTGVSGRAAGKIGQKLAQVARDRQVICVTHLAQVAAYGGNHLYIHKEVENGRTYTRVTPLEWERRVEELARITSGDHISAPALESARELLLHAGHAADA